MCDFRSGFLTTAVYKIFLFKVCFQIVQKVDSVCPERGSKEFTAIYSKQQFHFKIPLNHQIIVTV